MILDSRVGALDRTLGFLFGLGRGLIIVVVASCFSPGWYPTAASRNGYGRQVEVVLQRTGTMADVDVAG